MKRFTLLTLATMLIFAVLAFAGDKSDMKSAKAEMKAEMKGEHLTISGKLVCLGCSLKKEEGARAECSAFGHKHALQTEDGKYVTFLENKFAADLLKGEKYHNKPVEVHGVYFANANLLDVETFTVEGKKKVWCDHCSGMDGCMVGK